MPIPFQRPGDAGTDEHSRRVPGHFVKAPEPSELQLPDPRITRALAESLGIKGSFGLTLVPQLFPVVALTLDEAQAPTVPYQAQGWANNAAAVGFNSIAGLRNPVGSGIDLHMQSVVGAAPGAVTTASMRFRQGTSGAADAAGQAFFMDNPAAAARAVMVQDAIAPIGAPTAGLIALGPGQHGAWMPLFGWIIPPGGELTIQGSFANLQIMATFQWHEIPRDR